MGKFPVVLYPKFCIQLMGFRCDVVNSGIDFKGWWCDKHHSLNTMEAIFIIVCFVGSFGNLITVLEIIFSSLRYSVNCMLIGSLSFAGFLY